MINYTISLKSHFQHLWSVLLLAITMPIIGHYMLISKLGSYDFETGILAGLIFFIVFIGPILVLHFNHYLMSRDCSMTYNRQTGAIIFNRRGEEIKFNAKAISKVIVYKSYSMAQGRTPTLPTDIYNYAVIWLNDGKVLKISSLLIYEFDKMIQVDHLEVKKKLYTWIP